MRKISLWLLIPPRVVNLLLFGFVVIPLGRGDCGDCEGCVGIPLSVEVIVVV